jgi:hypothetical protein
MKIRPVAAELFHADGRRDRHEAKRRFSQFREERLKIESLPQSKNIVQSDQKVSVHLVL